MNDDDKENIQLDFESIQGIFLVEEIYLTDMETLM